MAISNWGFRKDVESTILKRDVIFSPKIFLKVCGVNDERYKGILS